MIKCRGYPNKCSECKIGYADRPGHVTWSAQIGYVRYPKALKSKASAESFVPAQLRAARAAPP
jgi:hypothetical protein